MAFPLSRRLFSSTYCTERSRPIWSTRTSLCLYPMTDVRAITPNCSGLSRPNCEIISSRQAVRKIFLIGIAGEILKRQYGEHDFSGKWCGPKVPPGDIACADQDDNRCKRHCSFPP